MFLYLPYFYIFCLRSSFFLFCWQFFISKQYHCLICIIFSLYFFLSLIFSLQNMIMLCYVMFLFFLIWILIIIQVLFFFIICPSTFKDVVFLCILVFSFIDFCNNSILRFSSNFQHVFSNIFE